MTNTEENKETLNVPTVGVSTLEDLEKLIERVHIAQNQFATFVEQIDKSKYYCVLALKIIEKLLAEVKL